MDNSIMITPGLANMLTRMWKAYNMPVNAFMATDEDLAELEARGLLYSGAEPLHSS